MMNLFSEEARRNPYPLYDQMRSGSPLLHVPPPPFNAWMIFDYEGVKQFGRIQANPSVPRKHPVR